MNPTSPATDFALDVTVGALVRDRPALSRVFETLQIDYCCGGKRPLGEALKARGLEPETGVAMLRALAAGIGPSKVDATSVATLSLSELANHIVATHHAYVRAASPRLVEMAERVSTKHGWRDERLVDVTATVRALAAEMDLHMAKEEKILFPLIRQLDANPGSLPADAIIGPISAMEADHDGAGDALKRLRALTGGYQSDENACNTHRALLAGLEEFEADLHRHVHKENNILFPRALTQAAADARN